MFQRRCATPISNSRDCRHNAHSLLSCLPLIPSPDCKQPPFWSAHKGWVKSSIHVTEEYYPLFSGQRKDMRIMKDIFQKKMNFPAPAQLSSFPLLDRLLVFNLKVWVFTRGKRFLWMSDIYIVQLCIWRAVLVVSMGFSMFRWNGQEYSQRPVYRGPASSVLYFSEQPTYSCWMVKPRILHKK